MEWLFTWLQSAVAWLKNLFVTMFQAVWDLYVDLWIFWLDLLLSAVASLIALIPVPQFVQQGMQTLFNNLGNDILWVAMKLQIGPALAVIGAGIGVRLVRKAVTVFQW